MLWIVSKQALYQPSYKPSRILSLMLGTEHRAFNLLSILGYRVPVLLKNFPEVLTNLRVTALPSPPTGVSHLHIMMQVSLWRETNSGGSHLSLKATWPMDSWCCGLVLIAVLYKVQCGSTPCKLPWKKLFSLPGSLGVIV